MFCTSDTRTLSPLCGQQHTADGEGEDGGAATAKRGKWPLQSGTSLLEQLKAEMKALSKEYKVGCCWSVWWCVVCMCVVVCGVRVYSMCACYVCNSISDACWLL